MIHIPSGIIDRVEDYGTIWTIGYATAGQRPQCLYFDWRPFAAFYEHATRRSFYRDYNFGRGSGYVAKQLQGRRISVEGEPFAERVQLDD